MVEAIDVDTLLGNHRGGSATFLDQFPESLN